MSIKNEKELTKKLKQVKGLIEECLAQLNPSSLHDGSSGNGVVSNSKKQATLREIIKGREFKNASEKLAVIVGYHEKVVKSLIPKDNLRREWVYAKFEGTYRSNLLDDASGVYVRVQSDGTCDLTQTGEEFFENFLKNEATKTTPQ